MNYTIVVDADKIHYFKEYLDGLELPIKQYPCQLDYITAWIFVQKIPIAVLNELSKYRWIGLLNTEQLSAREWESYYNTFLKNYRRMIHIFDYSPANVKILKSWGFKAHYLPFQYHSEDIEKLKQLLKKNEKLYDYAFIGGHSVRRDGLFKRLRDKGRSVIHLDSLWADARDEAISKARCLINIHFKEDYNVFEELRCTRWLFAGLPVFTEDSLYLEDYDLFPHLHVKKYQEIDGTETITSVEIPESLIEKRKALKAAALDRRIFSFWTGSNPLGLIRKKWLEKIKQEAEMQVIFLDQNNIKLWGSFHPAYEYLSAVHKADYLRCYFMHHYGGVYTDLKEYSINWNLFFSNSIVGYREIGPEGIAHVDDRQLYEQMKAHWQEMIGNCLFACEANTEFTRKWYEQVNRLLDNRLEALKLNPAKYERDQYGENGSLYPLRWTELLGNIFHPLVFEHRKEIKILDLRLDFQSYRRKARIGVAIPCTKKDLKYLEHCLFSIKKQKRLPDYVAVSVSEVERDPIIEECPFPVEFITHESKKDAAQNRNAAGNYLRDKVDIISYFDVDDVMHPERLSEIVRVFENSDADCILHNYFNKSFSDYHHDEVSYNQLQWDQAKDFVMDGFEAVQHQIGTVEFKAEKIKSLENYGQCARGHLSVASYTFEIIRTIEGFGQGEDSQYCHSLLKYGYRFGYLYQCLSLYVKD